MSFVYDDNGNLTNKTNETNETNYFYNIEDRLVRVEDVTGTVIAEYYYDPFGLRLWKEVGGVRTYFLYSDEGLVGEYDSFGVELKAYGYKPNTTFTTDPLFMKEGDNYYFYHNDHLATPQKVTSVNGAVVWSVKYSSFGKATVEVETVENNLRFPGQYYDEETGLHYNYYRYYHSHIGRYLRADPTGLSVGMTEDSGLFGKNHPYVYASNNPLNKFDFLGLRDCEKELANCARDAFKHDIKCMQTVADFFIKCILGCAIGCTAWGPHYLECLGICTAGCEYAAGGGLIYCKILLAIELFYCRLDYSKCKKDQVRKDCME